MSLRSADVRVLADPGNTSCHDTAPGAASSKEAAPAVRQEAQGRVEPAAQGLTEEGSGEQSEVQGQRTPPFARKKIVAGDICVTQSQKPRAENGTIT